MFDLKVSVLELIIRVGVIYFFILFMIRITGKKQIGQMAPFDLVLLLILSETVQNGMLGEDTSLLGALILSASLLIINHLVSFITYKSKTLEKVVEGKPRILIHNGKVDPQIARKECLTQDEIMEALRAKDCFSLDEVEYGILETNGTLSVKKYDPKKGSSPSPLSEKPAT